MSLDSHDLFHRVFSGKTLRMCEIKLWYSARLGKKFSKMPQRPTIDGLLNLVPDAPESVLSHLRTHPELASEQDSYGYSLLHAATSYEQLDLLKALIRDFHVDPNIQDEDGETCLFNAESVEVAKELINLGVNIEARNADGQTAAEKLDDEDEQPLVAAFLRGPPASTLAQTSSSNGSGSGGTLTNGETNGVHPPPPLPEGVQVNIGTMQASDVGEEPDPEFRRRIEELASRQDFEGDQGQRELRILVSDVVSGMASEGQGPSSRRRIG